MTIKNIKLMAEIVDSFYIVTFIFVLITILNIVERKISKKIKNMAVKGLVSFIKAFIIAFIVIIGIFVILSIFGVDVEKLAASLGVVTLILSFALQETLKDYIMGLSILIGNYYKVGDVISVDGDEGVVTSFTLKTTKYRNIVNGNMTSICNRNVSKVSVLGEFIDVIVCMGFDQDMVFSRKLVKECAQKISRLKNVYRCDYINLQEIAESWFEYKLRVFCIPEFRHQVRRDAQSVIQEVFYYHGVEFPYSIKVLLNYEPPKFTPLSEDPEKLAIYKKYKQTDHDLFMGRGRTSSKRILMNGSPQNYSYAISEAELYANSHNLDSVFIRRIVLLTEELINVIMNKSSMQKGEFWIEKKDHQFVINFSIDTSSNGGDDISAELLEDFRKNNIDVNDPISIVIARALNSAVNAAKNNVITESIKGIFTSKETNEEITVEKSLKKDKLDIDQEQIGMSIIAKMADDVNVTMGSGSLIIKIIVKK